MNIYNNLKQDFYQNRAELRHLVAKYPNLFFTFKAALYGFTDSERMITNKTEIVIEGFPCSANSFAVAAFRMAQDTESRSLRIAHHMHDPSQLIVAVKANIPAIVLIRYPDDAILSYAVRFFVFDKEEKLIELLALSLKKYIKFYKKILPYKSTLTIADFPILISAYDSIILQLNKLYAKEYKPFICSKSNIDRVFQKIEERNKQRLGFLDENSIARPSANKEKRKEDIKDIMKSSKLTDLFTSARSIYSEFTS